MTDDEFRTIFLEELARVAPDIDIATIGADDHLQHDLGLDSMDILNLVSALHDRMGIDIPEADYGRIATRAKAVAYLVESGRNG
jgi:acyl carrier protein